MRQGFGRPGAVAVAHPDLAAELRELWGAAKLADEFAR